MFVRPHRIRIASCSPQGWDEDTKGFNHNRNRTDPWTERPARHDGERRDRAVAALDRVEEVHADDLARVEKLVRGKDGQADAELVVAISNPNYLTVFEKYMSDPQFAAMRMTREKQDVFAATQNTAVRTAMTTTLANGGALIPFILDPTINLTNTGAINPFRRISKVVQLSNSNAWHGVTSANESENGPEKRANALMQPRLFPSPRLPRSREMCIFKRLGKLPLMRA